MNIKAGVSFVFLIGTLSCASYRDVSPPFKGSPTHPVKCDGPHGERIYLKRLRSPSGAIPSYRYDGAVLGENGNILDRFIVENPDSKESLPFTIDPANPPAYRIYMDMYHRDVCDTLPPPGFVLSPDDKP